MNDFDKIYRYRNLNILLNGSPVFADSIDISSKAAISPNFYSTERFTDKFYTQDFVNSSLKISYYLTGAEPLKDYFLNDGVISGNINGYYFPSGYLKNYSFNGKPFSPVLVDAEIVFFDGLSGQFNKSFVSSNNKIRPLNFRAVTLTNVDGIDLTNVVDSISYNYQAEIEPVRKSQEIFPSEVKINKKTITLDVVTNSPSGLMPLNGKNIAFDLIFNDSTMAPKEIFSCSGIGYDKSISVQAGQTLQNKTSITQNFVGSQVTISGYSPTSGYYYSTVNISGLNLGNIQGFYFYDLVQTVVNRANNSQMSCQVPEGSLSGQFGYVDYAGIKKQMGLFNVLDSGIQVTRVNPISGTNYRYIPQYIAQQPIDITNITISGANFFNVSNVYFGTGINAESFAVNDKRDTINALVPQGASYDFVNVISSRRQKTGLSPARFVPVPILKNFNSQAPFFGIPSGYNVFGAYVNFFGDGFSAITGMKFNSLPSVGNPPTFVQVNNSYMYASVPSGNTAGYINVKTRSGLSINSNFSFTPDIYITGITNNIFVPFSAITISGVFFIPELLHQPSASFCYVDFYRTGLTSRQTFQLSGPNVISGIVPASGDYWNIRIPNSDDSRFYTNTGLVIEMAYPPIITGFSPQSIHWYEDVHVMGSNFKYVTGVRSYSRAFGVYSGLSGFVVSADGNMISVNTTGGFKPESLLWNLTSKLFGVEVTSPYGTFELGGALDLPTDCLQIGDQKYEVSGKGLLTPFNPYYQESFDTLLNFNNISGAGAAIQKSTHTLREPLFYPVEYTFPALPGINWYNTGGLFDNYYNLPRKFITRPGHSWGYSGFFSGLTARYASDFSANTSGFTEITLSLVSGNADGVNGVNDTLLWQPTGSGAHNILLPNVFVSGLSYYVKMNIFFPQTNNTMTNFTVSVGNGTNPITNPSILRNSAWQNYQSNTFTYSTVNGSNTVKSGLFLNSNGTVATGDKAYLKDVYIYFSGYPLYPSGLLPTGDGGVSGVKIFGYDNYQTTVPLTFNIRG